MATAAAVVAKSPKVSLREDLTCAICCDLFREPVMLACMHHFCKSCISRYWRGTLGPVTCPQCRKEFSSKQFQTNYLVTAMVEKVRATTSDTYVKNLEKQLKETLESHRLKKEDFINSIRRDKDKMDTIKRVGADLQARVKGEFRALYQILHDEETCALEQLRREQEEELEKVQRHLEATEMAVRELEDNMRALQQASAATENIILTELPQLRSRVQVDVAPEFDTNAFSNKYLAPLQYITWRKMFKSLKPGPAPLTFDVDTAHPNIQVSRDKTAAVECDVMVPHTDHNKRFLQCVNILAAQGFQSGRHYWEVEVGSKPKWDLGVASEAVDRHARIKLSPETGYWTLRLRNGSEYSAGTQPWTRLQMSSSPQRLGVFLDCDERRVSFYNADDMSLLYSFTNGPRGKAFPFFSPCISGRSQKPPPIKLLHYHHVALSG
ncbi:tripartite motif containing 105 [Sander lucioperca]|uniref:Tripartite motif containing 105 n=1 Tax=Sander lucioperca TaxID=283035 RepID=A0A8C9Z828_SANLU|nr:tripartite motif containing 105 [Sander lucioperca]XP_031175496.1 tripartite motif containing 105 [Sander lucioperca]XP_031175497.1 tripartite motif containing 105 [Sander lucioperca]XP_031175498.1 tripartite motif containing 105 [Sander lucioperca]